MTAYKIGVLGASGYTGADLIRLALAHPYIDIAALSANTHAKKQAGEVFSHFKTAQLPNMVKAEDIDWSGLDAVFCGLPHGTSQELIVEIVKFNPDIKIIDMSADFRLRDPQVYAQWYGREHTALSLQGEAVYGLTEHYRADLKNARLIACPGCYPTATLLSLLPLLKAGLISADDVIIDAKSGVSGAGRGLKQNTLFCEAGEGMSCYSVAQHRHAPEIEQEISLVSGQDNVIVNFTPYLVPMSRGELVTSHVRLAEGKSAASLRNQLINDYGQEPFVHVLDEGQMVGTQMIRGSNHCVMNVFEDRIPGRAIVVAALDNLVKGSAGQALQNFNIAMGLDETTGLMQIPLFP